MGWQVAPPFIIITAMFGLAGAGLQFSNYLFTGKTTKKIQKDTWDYMLEDRDRRVLAERAEEERQLEEIKLKLAS